MSFRYQILQSWKRKAGLAPMPAFLRDYGRPLEDDEWADYVDHRYFSPMALQWADMAVNMQKELRDDDRELFARIWEALRAGRKPTIAQENQFRDAEKHRDAECQKTTLVEAAMFRKGMPYGPDYVLSNGVELPNANTLFDKDFSASKGITEAAAKQQRLRWRKQHAAQASGTH